MAKVLAVIFTDTGVSMRTSFGPTLTRMKVLELLEWFTSACTPPNVTVAMLSPCPNRLVPAIVTVKLNPPK